MKKLAQLYPRYQRLFSRAGGIFGVGRRPKPRAAKPLTLSRVTIRLDRTGNRARKVSGTQGSPTFSSFNPCPSLHSVAIEDETVSMPRHSVKYQKWTEFFGIELKRSLIYFIYTEIFASNFAL